MALNINGEAYELAGDPRVSLLDSSGARPGLRAPKRAAIMVSAGLARL